MNICISMAGKVMGLLDPFTLSWNCSGRKSWNGLCKCCRMAYFWKNGSLMVPPVGYKPVQYWTEVIVHCLCWRGSYMMLENNINHILGPHLRVKLLGWDGSLTCDMGERCGNSSLVAEPLLALLCVLVSLDGELWQRWLISSSDIA
jgi:hypothetical protein